MIIEFLTLAEQKMQMLTKESSSLKAKKLETNSKPMRKIARNLGPFLRREKKLILRVRTLEVEPSQRPATG